MNTKKNNNNNNILKADLFYHEAFNTFSYKDRIKFEAILGCQNRSWGASLFHTQQLAAMQSKERSCLTNINREGILQALQVFSLNNSFHPTS